jgi:DNA-binding GntR family transcriptional regulator
LSARAIGHQAAYQRIASTLRKRIDNGELEPGAMLPSEAEIGQEFGVARGTVRQALAELELAGLVVTQAGRGRRVQRTDGLPAEDVRSKRVAHTRYEKVAEQIRSAIHTGEFGPESRLPGEHKLAQRYGTARVTVRRALEQLQEQGLITVIPSKGRFVTPKRKQRATSDRPTRKAKG